MNSFSETHLNAFNCQFAKNCVVIFNKFFGKLHEIKGLFLLKFTKRLESLTEFLLVFTVFLQEIILNRWVYPIHEKYFGLYWEE